MELFRSGVPMCVVAARSKWGPKIAGVLHAGIETCVKRAHFMGSGAVWIRVSEGDGPEPLMVSFQIEVFRAGEVEPCVIGKSVVCTKTGIGLAFVKPCAVH